MKKRRISRSLSSNPTINVQSTSLKASATLVLFTFASLGEQQKRRVPFCFFHCTLPHETRSKSKLYCECRWCRIARMNGLEVRRFQQEVEVGRKGKEEISVMFPKCGKRMPMSQIESDC